MLASSRSHGDINVTKNGDGDIDGGNNLLAANTKCRWTGVTDKATLKLTFQSASYCQKPQTNRLAYYDIEYRKSVTQSPESPYAAFRAPQWPMLYSEVFWGPQNESWTLSNVMENSNNLLDKWPRCKENRSGPSALNSYNCSAYQ